MTKRYTAVMPLAVYKPLGLTPLETITLVRNRYPKYAESTIAYAGRLDPMAEGVMVLLIDEENQERDAYLGWGKDYTFSFLVGLSTDTHDLMGIPKMDRTFHLVEMKVLERKISRVAKGLLGTFDQEYPAYSAKDVGGKPLWWWARQERMSEIEVPTKNVTITELRVGAVTMISADALLTYLTGAIGMVAGDFRQELIVERWKEVLGTGNQREFPLINMYLSGSSGIYVRQLVNDIGRKLGLSTVTFSITRTRVGPFGLDDTLATSA